MNILALDLGTKCGWATIKESGTWNFQPSKFDSAGERYHMFYKELSTTIFSLRIDRVFYEEVRMHIAIDAAHVYGALMGILQLVCLEQGIPYKGVPVGTIKKFATGKGNAGKEDMVNAAIKLFPATNVVDDNHADALCLLAWALKNL